jgi:hypothetical protein
MREGGGGEVGDDAVIIARWEEEFGEWSELVIL